jgi:cation-transporting ATPase 13A1
MSMREIMEKMQEDMKDANNEVPQIKLGDASVAAPFTSKISTVMAGTKIFNQVIPCLLGF